jgi:DNA-binding transcriptional LysR family regulator
VLARQQKERSVVVGASGFMAGAWLTARPDVVGIAPTRIVEMLLVTFEPPMSLPPIEIVQVWHARSDAHPRHRWFRALVEKLLDHQA